MLAIALLGAPIHAQSPPERGPLNRELPKWLTLGVTQRVRGEAWGDVAFDPSDDDVFVNNRLQVNAAVRASRHVTVFAEVMDSRANGLARDRPRPEMRDPLDLR